MSGSAFSVSTSETNVPRSTRTDESSFTDFESFTAVGLSLTGFTVIETVLISDSSAAEQAGAGPEHGSGSPRSVTL